MCQELGQVSELKTGKVNFEVNNSLIPECRIHYLCFHLNSLLYSERLNGFRISTAKTTDYYYGIC